MTKKDPVALTPLVREDGDALFRWINDRETAVLNAPYRPVGCSRHEEWFDAIQKREDVAIFAIRRTDTRRLIGTCQLHSISAVHRSAELQIRIGEASERGKGYGSAAVRLLLEFAFRDLNLRRVYLHAFATNEAAVRLYRGAGFREEGRLREAFYVDGRYVDVVLMARLRDEDGRA